MNLFPVENLDKVPIFFCLRVSTFDAGQTTHKTYKILFDVGVFYCQMDGNTRSEYICQVTNENVL